MRAFVDLYRALDATNSSGEKVSLLRAYLSSASEADAAWCVALVGGHRPRAGATSAELKRLALERSGIPGWLLSECRAAAGDLSETLALVVPAGGGDSAGLSLDDTMRGYVLPLAKLDEGGRAALIGSAWDRFDREERFVYHKLVRGGLRVGVAAGLLSRAIAEASGLDRELVQHRLAGGFEPDAEAWRALVAPGDGRRVGPYPFFLASQLEAEPESLGDLGDAVAGKTGWIAEWKWDGVRAQVVRRDGETTVWSRTGEPMSAVFPELVRQPLPDGTVLDGEVVLWCGDRPEPFASLQKRLNRKVAPTAQLGLFETSSVRFLAFDVLERGGEDVRERPLGERRAMLSALCAGGALRSIVVSEPLEASSWTALAAMRAGARERGVEGLMLKRLDSAYGIGRRKEATGGAAWWKWKVDPMTADCVLTTAYPGSGRRASLYTDYGFSVLDEGGDLVAVTRAYSGLENAEIEELDTWIRRHTVARHGPVREVEPTRMFEIGFEGIAESSRHKAGLALRFPRILRERSDKPVSEATTLASLRNLAATLGRRFSDES